MSSPQFAEGNFQVVHQGGSPSFAFLPFTVACASLHNKKAP